MTLTPYYSPNLTSTIIKETLGHVNEGGRTSVEQLYRAVSMRLPVTLQDQLQLKGGKNEYRRIINYLKQRGYVSKNGRGDEATISITHHGAMRLQRMRMQRMSLEKNGMWDEKWRIVTFEIPEQQKVARNGLRRVLKQLGFKKLYRSVWVHPLPCAREIRTIKDRYGINGRITLLEVATFEEEARFKWLFREVIQ